MSHYCNIKKNIWAYIYVNVIFWTMNAGRFKKGGKKSRLGGYKEPPPPIEQEPEYDPVQELAIREYEEAGEDVPEEILEPRRKKKYLPGERLLIQLDKDRKKNKMKRRELRHQNADMDDVARGISRMVTRLTL